MLTIENISYEIDKNILFSGVGLTILPCSLFLVKGRNGSGKTTLLKILAGLIKPYHGIVKWNEVDIQDDIALYQQECLSFLGAEHYLKPELTLMENLECLASRCNNYELILPAMMHFNLFDFADFKLSDLSHSISRKVALAQLIIENNDLWIIDEPEHLLDPEAKDQLQKLITVKVREGGTVIIASDSLDHFPLTSTINIESFKRK